MYQQQFSLATLPVPLAEFKTKALQWADAFAQVAYYEPNQIPYPYQGFRNLLAVSNTYRPVSATDAFTHLQAEADILSKAKKENLENAIYRFTRRNVPIYFTRYEYGAPVAIGEKQDLARRILLVTAIAHPQPLVKYLQEAGYHVLKQYIFPDHHAYTPGEVQKIFIDWQRYATAGKVVVFTTRKDAAKLTDPALAAIFRTMPFFYIPVKVTFVENQAGFDTLILNQLPTRSKSEIN